MGEYHGAGGLDEEFLLVIELLHLRRRIQHVDVVLRLCGTCNTTTCKTTPIRTQNLTKKKRRARDRKYSVGMGRWEYNGDRLVFAPPAPLRRGGSPEKEAAAGRPNSGGRAEGRGGACSGG